MPSDAMPRCQRLGTTRERFSANRRCGDGTLRKQEGGNAPTLASTPNDQSDAALTELSGGWASARAHAALRAQTQPRSKMVSRMTASKVVGCAHAKVQAGARSSQVKPRVKSEQVRSSQVMHK